MGHLPFTGSIARSGFQIVPDWETMIIEKDLEVIGHVKNFLRTPVSINIELMKLQVGVDKWRLDL
jgi:hypothetical protein